MKKLIRLAVIFFYIAAAGSSAQANRAIKVVSDLDHKKGKIGTYHALIIGVQNYDDPEISDLDTPIHDAKALNDVLQDKYGFKTKLLLDKQATKKAIFNALRALSEKVNTEDSVLIYYAGHGEIDKASDGGWWIPVDAQGGDPFTYLDNVLIQKALRTIPARHVLLISDSCYSGTLFGKSRSLPKVINDKYYLELFNEKSRWGMTSGNKTPVMDSGSNGHSVFAYQLIKKLEKNDRPYLSTQELYTYIAPVIANNSDQTPMCRPIIGTGDMGGEFIFVSTNSSSTYETGHLKEVGVKSKTNSDTMLDKQQTAKLTSVDTTIKQPNITAHKGKFVKYDSGIVYDMKTGLEWFVGPDKDTNWYEAKIWIESLNVGGGGWRMPSIDEIKNLYKEGAGPGNITPLLATTGTWIWSEKMTHKLDTWGFSFTYNKAYGTLANYTKTCRAFAVRSRRK